MNKNKRIVAILLTTIIINFFSFINVQAEGYVYENNTLEQGVTAVSGEKTEQDSVGNQPESSSNIEEQPEVPAEENKETEGIVQEPTTDEILKPEEDKGLEENTSDSIVEDKEQNKGTNNSVLVEENLYDSNSENVGEIIFEYAELANINDVDIISSTIIKKETAKIWAKSKGATEEFIGLADLYWEYSSSNGEANPAVAYAQAAKETGYGKFGGVIDASYHNPCGLKTTKGGADNDPAAHQRFNSWDEGVQAHLDHLALYAGAVGYPRVDTFDPRHFASVLGSAKTVEQLGGKWAPSDKYGKEILKLYNEILEKEYELNGPFPGWNLIDNQWYYYNEDRQIVTGWLLLDTTWYYLNNNGQIQTGMQMIDGLKYYFNEDGIMQTDWQYINGNWYYFTVSGAMKTGWALVNNRWYYLNANGTMATGSINIDSIWYYIDEYGVMQTGWNFVDGAWKYYNAGGGMVTGWIHDNNLWYYSDIWGRMQTGKIAINGVNYYLNEYGVMQTGWQFLDGAWKYFNIAGGMVIGWVHIDNIWYYLNNSGSMQTGFIDLDGLTYYLNEYGAMQTGWQVINNEWYYFYPSGYMARNTIVDGYVINENGIWVQKKKLIVIDPGHNINNVIGRVDTGSQSTHNGVLYDEGELNMQIALKLKNKLEKMGYSVAMTRTPFEATYDKTVDESLKSRANFANSLNADAFVSIHHNSYSDPSVKGVEVWYSSNKVETASESSKEAGKNLATNMVNSLATEVNYINRKAKDGNLYVTKNTNMPSVLVEAGFISNPDEAKKAKDPANQEKIAEILSKKVEEMF